MARATNNKEASILNFFRTAPIGSANVLFNIVRSEIRERNNANSVVADAKPARKRKPATRSKRARKVPPAVVVAEPVAEDAAIAV